VHAAAAERRRLAQELAMRCRVLGKDLDPRDAERRAFEEVLARGDVDRQAWSHLYQDFLDTFAPERRRARGVYYTPLEVVEAQVRLVDDVLRRRLSCPDGLADGRVTIVDPATGSGAYPLAIVDRVGRGAIGRMRLFEPLPGAAAIARARGLVVEERDALSVTTRFDSPVVVCIGNPPYRRQTGNAWTRALVNDLAAGTPGMHAKNLYNDYVYFWRWALRAVFEQRSGAGIVCFITAASYLRGPAFDGLRKRMVHSLDDLWVVDLEGDHLAARKTDNVFPIRTPVAIALGVRSGDARRDQSAVVHYFRVTGDRATKLATLEAVRSVGGIAWRRTSSQTFVPSARLAYAGWPRLTDLFPWQLSGAQLKRTWPIAPTPDVLRQRWQRFVQLAPADRASAFGPTRDRDLFSAPPDLLCRETRLRPLAELTADDECLEPVPYAYRSFDRHWVLPDARLGDFMRSALWRVAGPRQVFLTSLLTNVLGPGPAAVATALVPDLDCFRGSFGARAVIPLWRDAAATVPNVDSQWLDRLSERYGVEVRPDQLMAYCYALLATRGYVCRFADELRTPGPRMLLANDAELFQRVVRLGERALKLHTYSHVPHGQARCLAEPCGYPAGFSYEARAGLLRLGDGGFGPITHDVWTYSVSGLQVLRSWLRRRMPRSGKSPLDRIGPTSWTAALSRELLELVWVLEGTMGLEPLLDAALDEISSGSDQDIRGRWALSRGGP
jgi:Type ISP C-terminal specificity domain/N-6 DNA Methylase